MELILLFFYRFIINTIFVQTYFDPDEYWQSLEVAHYLKYGYGILTWEWIYGIRSYFHPFLFYIQYLFISNRYLLIIIPNLFQSFLSFLTDYYLFQLSKSLYSFPKFILYSTWMNWFHFYIGIRTYSNNLETFMNIFILNYPKYWYIYAGISCLFRPTNSIFYLPLLFSNFNFQIFFFIPFFLLIQFLFDSYFYNRPIFTILNFIRFNLNHSSLYGTHPWHWYFTQAIPVLLGPQFILFIIGIYYSKNRKYLYWSIYFIFIYSFLSHKEFRFIYPILPLLLLYVGEGLFIISKKKYFLKFFIIFYFINIILLIYFSMIHQRGSLDIMRIFRDEIELKENSKILFYLPCHTTPGYSHLHINITLDYIDCSPFQSINQTFEFEKYSYIVLYSQSFNESSIKFSSFQIYKKIFYSFLLIDSRQSRYLYLLKNKNLF